MSYFGKPIQEHDRADITALFESSGAIRYGIEKMNAYFDEASWALEESGMDTKLKATLQSLIVHIRERTT